MTTATNKKNSDVKVTGLEDEVVVQVGPPLIQTAEDARMAYLRGQLTEEELRKAMGRFGMAGGVYGPPASPEPIDVAFENKVPDDLKEVPAPVYLDIEERQKLVDAKREKRELFTDAHDKVMKDADLPPQVVDPNVKIEASVSDAKEKALDKKIADAVASVHEDDSKK